VNDSIENYRQKYLGFDRSNIEYVQQVQKTWEPYISSGFVGLTGRYYVAIGVPITNQATGEHIGILATTLYTSQFFDRYGNTEATDSQLIIAVDRTGTYLISANKDVIGKNFFSDEIQQMTGGNPYIYRMYSEAVKSGELSSTVFDTGSGERFAAASPVYYNGQQVMTLVTSIPTASIYSQVDDILSAQRIQTAVVIVLLVAVAGAVIGFMLRWNASLEKKVRQRTMALAESNLRLEQHDKMQQEFINVAAHELRTPIQPLLGISDLIEQSAIDNGNGKIEITKEDIAMITRNAKRLERLSSDILEVSRVESKSLKLNKETVDMNQKIQNVIDEVKGYLRQDQNVDIIFNPKSNSSPVFVSADKGKIFEVLSNLVRNAINFTHAGKIEITLDQRDGQALVAVKDSGQGIDPEIMPRLFQKFVTKSHNGTGLGLYLSKAIIEEHGGRIWAENNASARGATFYFTLPTVIPTTSEKELLSNSESL
jgi:signal transduction histidine kinase